MIFELLPVKQWLSDDELYAIVEEAGLTPFYDNQSGGLYIDYGQERYGHLMLAGYYRPVRRFRLFLKCEAADKIKLAKALSKRRLLTKRMKRLWWANRKG